MRAPTKPMPPRQSIFRRFVESVRVTKSCWEWEGARMAGGYGVLSANGTTYRAHRLALHLSGVEIPIDMDVDHMCKNRACVNPDHLRVVTPRTNALENSESPPAQNARKTHCKNGHEFTVENTGYCLWKGRVGRKCLLCQRRFNKLWQRKRRAAQKLGLKP